MTIDKLFLQTLDCLEYPRTEYPVELMLDKSALPTACNRI